MIKMLSFLYKCVHAQCCIHLIHHLEFYFWFKVSCGIAIKLKSCQQLFQVLYKFSIGEGEVKNGWLIFPQFLILSFFGGSSSFLTSSSLFRLSSYLRSSYFIRSSSSLRSSMLDAWWDPSCRRESTNYKHGHLDKQKLDTKWKTEKQTYD